MNRYKLVIASNFLSHYQYTLSIELLKYFDVKYIVCEKLESEYEKLGFSDLNNNDFVVKAYENKKEAEKAILECDLLLVGSYKYRNHIIKRYKENKRIYYISERLFKTTNIVGTVLRYIKYWTLLHFDKKSFLLCISAYAAKDYNDIGLFKNRTYKWGYFPEIKEYPLIDDLIKAKEEESIFWAGRLIEWKHPEYAVNLARKLKEENYNFSIKIAGNGKLSEKLEKLICENKLQGNVELLGSMPPEKIRKQMEKSQIYLFTSTRAEGWGVVLNEAMNSACAIVASEAAGSTPFLINDGNNGYIYKNNSVDDLYIKVKNLLDNKTKTKLFAKEAYETIFTKWNCKEAAKRLAYFFENDINGNNVNSLFEEGILSKVD